MDGWRMVASSLGSAEGHYDSISSIYLIKIFIIDHPSDFCSTQILVKYSEKYLFLLAASVSFTFAFVFSFPIFES